MWFDHGRANPYISTSYEQWERETEDQARGELVHVLGSVLLMGEKPILVLRSFKEIMFHIPIGGH